MRSVEGDCWPLGTAFAVTPLFPATLFLDVPFAAVLPFFPLDFFAEDDLLAADLPLGDDLPLAFLVLSVFDGLVLEVLAADPE